MKTEHYDTCDFYALTVHHTITRKALHLLNCIHG